MLEILFTCRLIVHLLSVNRAGKEYRLNSDFSGVGFTPLGTLYMNAFFQISSNPPGLQ